MLMEIHLWATARAVRHVELVGKYYLIIKVMKNIEMANFILVG
jgi:hypothetical protein